MKEHDIIYLPFENDVQINDIVHGSVEFAIVVDLNVASNLCQHFKVKWRDGTKSIENAKTVQPHHLYLLSDDSIKGGDIMTDGKGIYDAPDIDGYIGFKKVVASTNQSLLLPGFEKVFIEDWVKNPVYKVDVWCDSRRDGTRPVHATEDNNVICEILPEERKRKPLSAPIQHLADAIEKKGLQIKFGLEQQGHIPTIERTLDEFKRSSQYVWEKIGKEIGWDPNTACYYYIDYLRKQMKPHEI